MYKVVVIGSGQRAPAHIEAYKHIPHAQVVAVSDRTGKRSAPLAETYGIKAYTSAEEMIRMEKPDLVHIVTMPESRVELMSLVADMNVPLCTVEKPIALGVRDWNQLKELEASSTTRFATSHQFRWQPHLTACREAIQEGKVGEVRFLNLTTFANIADQGTHILNYGMSLIGNSPVTQVFGNAEGWMPDESGHPSPAATVAYLSFENGVRGVWSAGPMSPQIGEPMTSWSHMRIEAFADRGRTLYEMFGKWEVVSDSIIMAGEYGGMEGWRKNDEIAQAGFHQSMFAWLEDETNRPGTDLKQSLHEWSVVLALYQSVLENRAVSLADFNPSENLFDNMKHLLHSGQRR